MKKNRFLPSSPSPRGGLIQDSDVQTGRCPIVSGGFTHPGRDCA